MNNYLEYENFIKTHPWKQISIKGEEISYRQCGKGTKTILLLLGGSMFSSDAYFKMVSELESKYQLIMIDYPKNIQTVDALTTLISEVMSSLEINRFYVFGTNYGGGIAQAFAKSFQENVEGLILYNTLTKTKEMSDSAKEVVNQVIEAINELSALREMMPLDTIKNALLDQIKEVINQLDDLKLYEKLISLYTNEDEKLQMRLIKDLLTNSLFTPDDFKYLKDKTLLFYAHDDDPLGGTELIETLADLYESPYLAFVETDRFNLIINPYEMVEHITSFIK